jgi:hypothetical protein
MALGKTGYYNTRVEKFLKLSLMFTCFPEIPVGRFPESNYISSETPVCSNENIIV